MPGPRDIVIYWPGPQAFSVMQKPWGWSHILVQKPQGSRGDGNRSNWYLQIDISVHKGLLWSESSYYGLSNADEIEHPSLTSDSEPNTLPDNSS